MVWILKDTDNYASRRGEVYYCGSAHGPFDPATSWGPFRSRAFRFATKSAAANACNGLVRSVIVVRVVPKRKPACETAWVIKRTDDYYNSDAEWSKPQRSAHRYSSEQDARIDADILRGRGLDVRVVRLSPKRKPQARPVMTVAQRYAGVAADDLATRVDAAHESGRIAERKRWAAEFRRRARALRQWAEEARGKGQGVVARTNDICAAQLDVIADAMVANDPSAVELP
jgi:hypothetical protein